MPWKLNYTEQAPHRQHTLADGAHRRHVSIRVNFQFVTDNQNCAPASRAEIIHLTMGPCNTISTTTISTRVSHLRPRQRGEPRVAKSICFFEVQAQTARRKAILSILTVSMFTVSPKQNAPRSGVFVSGGEGGIRTLEGLATFPVFETGTFNHSATSPKGAILPAHASID